MMMPENIELRIKDMTTLNDCIDEVKACLTICQPSSLVSKMNTLTLAENSTPHSQSPSPACRSQINNNTTNNRQGRPRQRPSILKRLTFQGFRQYPGNVRHSSLSNSRNTIPNTRFRSFSRSQSRPRFGTTLNRPLECYYCHHLGHTANNCFRRQNRNFPRRQPNQGRRNFTIRNFRPYTNIIDTMSLEIEITMQLLSAELISQILLCIQIYTWGIINRCQFSGSHFQRNFISN